MARDRQKAKQRQAERRARRLAQQGEAGAAAHRADADREPRGGADDAAADRGAEARVEEAPPAVSGIDDVRAANPAPGVFPDIAVGAPPEDVGRTDRALRDEPELDDDYGEEDPELEQDAIEAGALQEVDDRELEDGDAPAETYAPRGRRGEAAAGGRAKDRPRVVQFLIAVWAELQRVQWPNRQALTTLTGVVLGFVLIAGGYLGLLDAIFSRIIQAIL
jgi:preprotein translocase subunit SecE